MLTPATVLDMVNFPKGWGAQKADSNLSPVFNLLYDLKIVGLRPFRICMSQIRNSGVKPQVLGTPQVRHVGGPSAPLPLASRTSS